MPSFDFRERFDRYLVIPFSLTRGLPDNDARKAAYIAEVAARDRSRTDELENLTTQREKLQSQYEALQKDAITRFEPLFDWRNDLFPLYYAVDGMRKRLSKEVEKVQRFVTQIGPHHPHEVLAALSVAHLSFHVAKTPYSAAVGSLRAADIQSLADFSHRICTSIATPSTMPPHPSPPPLSLFAHSDASNAKSAPLNSAKRAELIEQLPALSGHIHAALGGSFFGRFLLSSPAPVPPRNLQDYASRLRTSQWLLQRGDVVAAADRIREIRQRLHDANDPGGELRKDVDAWLLVADTLASDAVRATFLAAEVARLRATLLATAEPASES